MKIAFTIATSNYLAQAKSIADSFIKHNNEYTFIIVLLDKKDESFDYDYFLPSKVLEVETLAIPEFFEMVSRYTIFELSNALKPFVANFLLVNSVYSADVVLYFDSDIFVYQPLTEIEDLFKSYDVILSPHLLSPLPADGLYLEEKAFLNAGIYNGGFFAVKKSQNTLSFISWWKTQLISNCLIDFSKGLFVDQIWLNLVPLFFENVYIIKSVAYNVAYWNLHERTITFYNNQYIVNNTHPLFFFHFSGYDIMQPDLISKYQNRYSFDTRKDIVLLFEEYAGVVKNNNYVYFSKVKCYYIQWKEDNNLTGREVKLTSNKKMHYLVKKFFNKLIRKL